MVLRRKGHARRGCLVQGVSNLCSLRTEAGLDALEVAGASTRQCFSLRELYLAHEGWRSSHVHGVRVEIDGVMEQASGTWLIDCCCCCSNGDALVGSVEASRRYRLAVRT